MAVAEKHHTDWKRPSEWAMPALLLVVVSCFFWKLVFTNQYTWLDSPDAANQVLPWYQFQAGEWHAGRMPLWDPYLWGGQPLLAQAQPGAAYPPNWLLFLMPLRRGWIRQPYMHWYFVLIHFQAALFSYWLCRDLKRSHAASLLSGLAFGLGGFVGTNNWPQMLNGAVWAPLVLLFFLRAMRGERPVASAAWSGAFLGIAFLSGHHQIPTFIGLAMAGAWLYYLTQDRRRWRLLLVFGAFLTLVSAFQVLPAYEYGGLSLRWVGAENPLHWKDRVPYYIHQRFGLPPESVLGIVIPGLFRNSDPFMGLVAFTLAFLGIVGNWKDQTARLFGAISLGGLLFALGANSVFNGVIYSLVPLVEKARNDSMAIFIFHFGLAVLVAYGIDSYQSLDCAFSRRVTALVCGFAVLVGVATTVFLVTKTPADDRLGMVVLIGLGFAALLSAWRNEWVSPLGAKTLLAMLMLLELGNVTTYALGPQVEQKTIIKQLADHFDIAQFLSDQDEPVRAEIDEADIPYNFGDWYGIDHFGGYLASLTENVNRVQGNTKARLMYATNFHVGKNPSRPDQVEVFSSRSGVKVHRNPGAFPRAWVVHDAISIERDDQIGPLLDTAAFDTRNRTFIKGKPPALESCQAPETVTLLTRHSNKLTLEANLKCRGMVIDADTYFPGWEATVDGKPAAVYEAYGFLRGVVVDGGWHRIEVSYRPKSVYLGAGLTAVGLLGAALLRIRVE